jgi:MFS family permease
MLAPLRNPAFRLAWTSYTASSAATAILPIALTLYVLDAKGSVTVLGLVLGARTIGFILGALFGGVIADRLRRKMVLAAASGLRGAATLAAIAAFSTSVVVICACVLLAGAGEGVFRSAYQAVVGETVDEQDRQAANAATTLSMRLCLTGGPLLTIWLYAQFGGPISLAVAGLLWVGSALVVLPMRLSAARPASSVKSTGRPGILQEYREGLREGLRHRWFVGGLGALVVWLSLAYSVQQLVLPLVSRGHFGGDTLIGIALGAYSAGAVIGALLLGHWTPRRPGVVAFLALSLYGLVPLALFVGDQSWLIVLAYLLGGFGIEVFNIPWFTAIQREVPSDKLGRVSALDFLVSYGVAPLGLAGLPLLFDVVGQSTVLVGCGLLTMVAALAVLAIPGSPVMSDPRKSQQPRTAQVQPPAG